MSFTPKNRFASKTIAAVALVLLTATGCEYVEVDGVGTRTYDETYVPQDDITAFDGCVRNKANQWAVDGEITNHTPDRASYAVTIAFENDGTRIDERTVWIRNLAPGQAADLHRAWWITSPEKVTDCRVLTIDRFTQDVAESPSSTNG